MRNAECGLRNENLAVGSEVSFLAFDSPICIPEEIGTGGISLCSTWLMILFPKEL